MILTEKLKAERSKSTSPDSEPKRCLLVTGCLLEVETPRVIREISVMQSMKMNVRTIEPAHIYLGKGLRFVHLRGQSHSPPEIASRTFVPFYTLPMSSWLGRGFGLRGIVAMMALPILIALDFLLLCLELGKMISKFRPDFVLVLNAPDVGPLAVRMVTAVTGTPYVYECRDPAPVIYPSLIRPFSADVADLAEMLLKALEGLVAKGAVYVITVGESMSDYLKRNHGLRNCVVIYGSVRNSQHEFIRPRITRKYLTIVLSGTIDSKYFDLRTLLLAIAFCNQRGNQTRLKVIGSVDPEAHAEISAFSDTEVIPWQSWDDYMRILRNECDVGVIPARESPFGELTTPNKLFDYLAAGLPVLAPAFKGLTEIVGDDVTGFVYEPGSVDSIVRAIIKASDTVARSRMSRTCVSLFETTYSAEAQAAKLRVILADSRLRK